MTVANLLFFSAPKVEKYSFSNVHRHQRAALVRLKSVLTQALVFVCSASGVPPLQSPILKRFHFISAPSRARRQPSAQPTRAPPTRHHAEAGAMHTLILEPPAVVGS
jgi:hypothetical protein